MEIADYLRIIRKRFWIVVLIPLLAVVVTTAVIYARPTEYSSTATVAAPWLISNAPGDTYQTSNGASQFVADFVAALQVPPVLDAVAAATGIPEDALRDHVTSTPIGESTLIQVSYVSPEREEAGSVARAFAMEALRFLFRPSAVVASSEPAASAPDATSPTQQLEALLAQPETVSLSATRAEPDGPRLVRGLEVAVGGGLFLAILVVILLELVPLDRLRASNGRPVAGGELHQGTARAETDRDIAPQPVPHLVDATRPVRSVRARLPDAADRPGGNRQEPQQAVKEPPIAAVRTNEDVATAPPAEKRTPVQKKARPALKKTPPAAEEAPTVQEKTPTVQEKAPEPRKKTPPKRKHRPSRADARRESRPGDAGPEEPSSDGDPIAANGEATPTKETPTPAKT